MEGIAGLPIELDPNSWVIQLNLAIGESRVNKNGVGVKRISENEWTMFTETDERGQANDD